MSQAQVNAFQEKPMPSESWADANQAYLIAEFERIRRLIAREPLVEAAPWTDKKTRPAIEILATSFNLSGFEKDLLLLCAGVEMYQPLKAQQLKLELGTWPSFGLALEVLPEPHWSALTPQGPLRQWQLLQIQPGEELLQARLRISERLLHFLAGINYLEPELQPLLLQVSPESPLAPSQQAIAEKILDGLQRQSGTARISLNGPDRDGQQDIAGYVCQRLGLQLYALDMAQLHHQGEELQRFTNLWQREALLLNTALLLKCKSNEAERGLGSLFKRLSGLVFISAVAPPTLEGCEQHAVEFPGCREQLQLWRQQLSHLLPSLGDLELETLAGQFRFSARRIRSISQSLALEPSPPHAIAERSSTDRQLTRVLWQHCRLQDKADLEQLGEQIHCRAAWEDLVLPEDEKRRLKEIANQIKHRMQVYEEWGFAHKSDRGLGISALFHGESGTGKTMAAELLARELNLELYRIDLAAVVSKYIGETEKNLGKVFDAAENAGVILLFDEADALFGKRSEVKDSHDRYANLEISYLLQRMESYPGLSLLTTNSKSFLDPAFLRRIRFVVHFPFPDTAQRQAIWQRIIPTDAPTQALDHAKLAQLNMSGGSIRNIALMAAFLAAEQAQPISMAHLASAAQQEAAKKGKQLSEGQLRGWR